MELPQIMDSISLTIDYDFLCNALRVKADSEAAERLAKIVVEAHKVACPKAAYREVKIQRFTEDGILIDDVQFRSHLLVTNLTSATKLYAFVATCGTELEAWAKTFSSDLLESF